MNETSDANPRAISAVCADAIEAYREYGKRIQSPAIRKVLESVIRQKSEHVGALKALESRATTSAAPILRSAALDPEAALRSLVEHERAFAEAVSALGEGLDEEEARVGAAAMADSSRKFASWAQDHLDLLSMF